MNLLCRNSSAFFKQFVNASAFLTPPCVPSSTLRPQLSHALIFACPLSDKFPRTILTASTVSSAARRKQTNASSRAHKTKTKLSNSKPQKETVVSVDDSDGTLLSFVKRKSDERGVRKLFEAVKAAEDGTSDQNWPSPDAAVYRTAIRNLIRADRLDLALELHELRSKAFARRPAELRPDFRLTASVLRAAVRSSTKRSQRTQHSAQVFAQLRDDCIKLCDTQSVLASSEGEIDQREMRTVENTKLPAQSSEMDRAVLQSVQDDDFDIDNPQATSARYMAMALSDAIMTLFAVERDRTSTTSSKTIREEDLSRGVEAVRLLKRLSQTYGKNAALDVTNYNELIRTVGKARQVILVFDVIDAMRFAGVEKDGTTYEFVANATVRQVNFVTGAVSLETLPSPLGAEIAFVGRSNVGKSSLVNMLVNRKALAYVSGRPGKTQQFNYFIVNERDPSSAFHLVDLPGVGYAKVPRPIQDEWKRFMIQYFRQRPSLRLVFHLVDGRHGALADDEILMAEMGRLRGAFHYVVVLTKMDKMDKQKATRGVLDATRSALVNNGCGSDVPIVPTSAQSRLGRDEMWRHLQTALRTLQQPSSREASS